MQPQKSNARYYASDNQSPRYKWRSYPMRPSPGRYQYIFRCYRQIHYRSLGQQPVPRCQHTNHQLVARSRQRVILDRQRVLCLYSQSIREPAWQIPVIWSYHQFPCRPVFLASCRTFGHGVPASGAAPLTTYKTLSLTMYTVPSSLTVNGTVASLTSLQHHLIS